MAYSSLGPKRQPQFADLDAPDLAVNPTQVADYAAEFGNHKVGTAADRATATSWAWAGLHWTDTDASKATYRFDGSAWIFAADSTPWVTPTLKNLWVDFGAGYANVAYRRLNGVVYVRGVLKSGTVASGTELFTLPAGFRPTGTRRFPGVSNNQAVAVEVLSDGRVTTGTSNITNTSLTLDAIVFPADG